MRVSAAVVLAAGASRRMGSPKQLAVLGGETLLERAVRVARGAGCQPVVVVLGASADVIRAGCVLGDAEIVVNQDWAEGMGASVRAGVGALPDVDGCLVMTCDMPAVTPAHLRALMGSGGFMASSYAGRRGVPAYFPRSMFSELMTLRGDAGARDLLGAASAIELEGGDLDVDTVEDLERCRRLRFGC
jgi:molybdenum cofactor cytidylyltransferase